MPSHHHDLGADLDAAVEVDDVLIAHADAARGHLRADGPGLVRAVDAVERRAEIHRARAERIFRTAGHVARQVGPAPQHLVGRRPIRPFALVGDVVHAGPGEAGTADADAVAHRPALALHQIEHAVAGIDDDRPGSFRAVIADLLLHEAGVHDGLAGLVRRLDHSGAEVGGKLTIVGRRGLVARAAGTAEQHLEEAAAVFALRRDPAHGSGDRLAWRRGGVDRGDRRALGLRVNGEWTGKSCA